MTPSPESMTVPVRVLSPTCLEVHDAASASTACTGGGRGERGREGGGERMEEKRSETRQVEEICRVGKLYNCDPCTNAQYGILYGPWLGSDRDSTDILHLTSLVKKYTPAICYRFSHCMHCVLVTIGTQVERWTDTVKESLEEKMERGNWEKTGEEKRPGTE